MILSSVLPAVVLLFAVTSLIAIRGDGKNWAQVRLIAYPITAMAYAIFAISNVLTGAIIPALVAGACAALAGRGFFGVKDAWEKGDFRPKHQRKMQPPAAS